ncbi:MAG: hypothetical protein PHZ18_05970 [Methanoculleus sp.]|uniref:hypothetical protein n=1 Tax=Methanoculleus sp. TaxID=90427 RepID=UPI0025FF1254|nr:hypothetical protein [Methanoculleus sp.]MCK9319333.1 hypothetical protein [Methanoculleus sp.]MDD2255028.1 hypothetical protein [Methanoculleus sp.]MDD3216128.1 hypothetical protein [Methanoculleus sp.]HOI59625.1 hypothetical protein [Methanoculleus sp.]
MVLAGLLSAIRGIDLVLNEIPGEWNKDWFHFVNINDRQANTCYPGYLWATDNWVEAHCFANIRVQEVWKILDKDFHLHIDGARQPSQGICVQANKGFVFSNRILSFICPRDAVLYSTRGKWAKFYSHIFQFRDTVYCNPSDEDRERWKQWHPGDDYKTVFSGATVIGYYFGEFHQGFLCLRELRDNQIGPVECLEDYYLTYD